MNLQIVAQNVRRLRNAKRFSQKALADAACLSLPAIKNLELEKNEPRMRTIQSIARALDVKPWDLFHPVRELRTVRFRSAKQMRNRENILAEVARWLEDFNYLEKTLDKHIPFSLNEVRAQCYPARPAEAAGLCREKLDLKPDEPVHDICGLLEKGGVKVFPISTGSDGFFGLSLGEDDGGPAVVVNIWERISVERRIFSAAHELGHLMLHPEAYDVNMADENKEEEQEADCFAGYFLMPDQGFWKEWDEAAGLHFVDRVFKVKRIFRVSYRTVLRRLLESGYGNLDDSIWRIFNAAYQKRFNRKLPFKEEPMGIDSAEPFGMLKFDFYEDRFSRLTREALEKDMISISRGAEILRIGIEEMLDLLQNWEDIL